MNIPNQEPESNNKRLSASLVFTILHRIKNGIANLVKQPSVEGVMQAWHESTGHSEAELRKVLSKNPKLQSLLIKICQQGDTSSFDHWNKGMAKPRFIYFLFFYYKQ
jgi:hypothetical protein